MDMEEAGPADAALAAARSAFARLVSVVDGGGLDHLDDAGLLGFWQQLEELRNQLPVVEHRLIRDAQARDLASVYCTGRLSRLMTSMLRISGGEAARRVRAADQLGDRTSMLGEPVPPVRPALAAAQRAGEVNPEQVDIICRGLARVDRVGYDPATIAAGEASLTGHARAFGPADLQTCVNRFVDTLEPDGSRPEEELQADRRMVELRQLRDGSWRGELRLTGAAGAKLQAVLGPLAKPRISTGVTAAGRPVEELDPRTYPQRMHDALEDACDRLLRSGSLPDSGGTPATVIVTLNVNDLINRTGCGTTSDGTRLSTAAVLRLAEQAEVIPAVLNDAGAVLALGRAKRIATKEQTLALYARDGGCSFPGCGQRPEWCERHHIIAWADDGPTDLTNLTLVCRYHHHQFWARGWTCRINDDGLPEWTPPRHVDRHQRPLINQRILTAHGGYGTAA